MKLKSSICVLSIIILMVGVIGLINIDKADFSVVSNELILSASTNPTITVYNGGTYYKLSDYIPKRQCQEFTGWYTAPNGGSKVEPSNIVDAIGGEDNWSLYAHWKKKHEIFNSDGTINRTKITVRSGNDKTHKLICVCGEHVSDENHIFEGGKCIECGLTEPTITVIFDANDQDDEPKGEAIFGNQITLTYNANGGIGAPQAQVEETESSSASFTISSTKPTRSGYTFLGWAKNSNATEVLKSTSITVTENTTLYAVWKGNVSYTITYDANGGTGSVDSQTAVIGSNVTIKDNGFTNGNYTFDGWSYERMDPYDTGGPYDIADATFPGYTIELTKNITLYAMWLYDGEFVNSSGTINCSHSSSSGWLQSSLKCSGECGETVSIDIRDCYGCGERFTKILMKCSCGFLSPGIM